jgi:uncharacterized repeat protein (TIGR03803 family)
MQDKKWQFPSILALAILALSFSLAVRAQAQTFTTLGAFNGVNGTAPFFGSLVQDTNGNYYGSTVYGGKNGFGNIFQLMPAGKLSNLYSFCALADCADGIRPVVAPILGSDGNFYGTTGNGGNSSDAGTVYKMTIGGKLTTLYSFCPTQPCSDGSGPVAVIEGNNGNFYGVAGEGGAYGDGTFFELTSLGEFRVLHSFCAQLGCSTGSNPSASPMQASNGNFYGTAARGGFHSGGVVYEITPAGLYKALYNFCSQTNCADGSYPLSTLVQDANGNLYGTTFNGGAYESGTVFEITPSDQYVVIHSFNVNDDTDGGYPQSVPALANDGNLYGTTANGGNEGHGNIYQITPEGTYTSLYSFCNALTCSAYDAAYGLLQGTDGIFYGATADGGAHGDGVVYSFSYNLGPLVKTVPIAAAVGARVIVLGNGLTGTTSVTFNGTAATFTVVSDTEITATVPAGATTGTVQVTTPTQTLNSYPVFQVLSR